MWQNAQSWPAAGIMLVDSMEHKFITWMAHKYEQNKINVECTAQILQYLVCHPETI